MKRRTAILGGGALLAGAVGVGVTATGTLTEEPTDLLGTTTSPGVFDFNQLGVSTVAWEEAPGTAALLRVSYQDLGLPDYYRLHRSDGRKVWTVENPSGDSGTREFSLPLSDPGTWELVVNQDGDHISLQLPVKNQFSIDQFGLQGETLVVTVTNSTDSPNYLDYIRLSHAKTGRGKKYEFRKAVMPGQSHSFESPYPFNYYKDVSLWVVAGPTNDMAKSIKDFV